VITGIAPRLSTIMVDFLVVNRLSAYNAIISRSALNKLKVTTSTYHLMMKFPTEEGVGRSEGRLTCCKELLQHLHEEVLGSDHSHSGLCVRGQRELAEPLEEVVVGEGKVLQIGTCLTWEVRECLVDFLRKNMEVFAWSHADMLGINLEEIFHILNVDLDMRPVKQKRRKFAPERVEAITVEIEKLLKAQFIQEGLLPRMVGECSLGEEIQQKVEDVRGLHRPQ
jgi:hypothetical protein